MVIKFKVCDLTDKIIVLYIQNKQGFISFYFLTKLLLKLLHRIIYLYENMLFVNICLC